MGATAIEKFVREVEELIEREATLLMFDHGRPGDTLRVFRSFPPDVSMRAHTSLILATMRQHLNQWAEICKVEAHEICDPASLHAVYRDLDTVVSAVRRLPGKETIEEIKLREQSGPRHGVGLQCPNSAFWECYERRVEAIRDTLKSEVLQEFAVLSCHPKHIGRQEGIVRHHTRMGRERLTISKASLPPELASKLVSKFGLMEVTEVVPEVIDTKTSDVDHRLPGWTTKQAIQKGEEHIARNVYPGLTALARVIGNCPKSTMSKSVQISKKLRAAHADYMAVRNSRKNIASLSQADSDSLEQKRELSPSEGAALATDGLFQRLIDEATPEERAKLHSMTPQQRLALVAEIENDPNIDPESRNLRQKLGFS